MVYTPAEVRALTPVRQSVEKRAPLPDLRDVFLCHAWDDRQGAAKELHDLLESAGVSVWFSEKDVALGTPLLREIDRGLAKSQVGIVLVTPALLRRLQGEGIADKELSALLARDLLVPIVHGTTYEALREVSPLLGSRSGLSTIENPMAERRGQARRAARPVAPLPGWLAPRRTNLEFCTIGVNDARRLTEPHLSVSVCPCHSGGTGSAYDKSSARR